MVMVCSQGGVQFPAVINHLYGYFPCPSPGWRPELLLSSLVLAVRQLATSADAAGRPGLSVAQEKQFRSPAKYHFLGRT